MHHSWWSYDKTATPQRRENHDFSREMNGAERFVPLGATPQRRENHDFSREMELSNSYVWVSTTTLLCFIFLPVLVKAISCIDKDLGMSTGAYASLMVELQQDGYTSKTRESTTFRGKSKLGAQRFDSYHLGVNHYLVVLIFSCQCLSKPYHALV